MRTPAEQAEWDRVHSALDRLESAVDRQVQLAAKITALESKINDVFVRNTNITGKPFQPERKYQQDCKAVLNAIGVGSHTVDWDRIGRAYNDYVPVSRAVAIEAVSAREVHA